MLLKASPDDFVVTEVSILTPQDQGAYSLVRMKKRDMTTEQALLEVARQLGIHRKRVGYAGTKDRRAVTEQDITLQDVSNDRIASFRHDRITLTLLGRTGQQLRLGMLTGNRFRITARALTHALQPVTRIPNYFDAQRFSVANAEIGKRILQKEFMQATAMTIATDEHWAPRLQEWLDTHPNDAVGALRLLPQHQLLMYVHAYQSLLFNELLTKWILHHDPDAKAVPGVVQITLPSKEVSDVSLPMIGFDTHEEGIVDQWIGEILAREGLSARDFVVRQIPFLTVEGGQRDAFVLLEELEITPAEQVEDGLRQTASFRLPPGSYATVAMRCLGA